MPVSSSQVALHGPHHTRRAAAAALLLLLLFVVSCQGQSEPAGTPEAAAPPAESVEPVAQKQDDPNVESGKAEIEGGELYYEVKGEGHPLVLIAGANLDRRMWDDQFDLFARDYRVVRYDLRGFGNSSQAIERFFHHEDLLGLLAHLQIERAHLVGLSIGGKIAVDFALAYPDMVGSLVLASPGLSGWRRSPEGREALADVLVAAQQGDAPTAAAAWLECPYMAPAMENEEVAERLREITFANLRFWSRPLPGGRLTPPAIDRITDLAAPVLLIVGSRDVSDIQLVADFLAGSLPGVERKDFEGSGHLTNMERPEEFNRAVLDFLSN